MITARARIERERIRGAVKAPELRRQRVIEPYETVIVLDRKTGYVRPAAGRRRYRIFSHAGTVPRRCAALPRYGERPVERADGPHPAL